MMNVFRRPSGMMCHLAYIALVSLYDSWLVVLYSESILSHEQNLVGRYLIRLRAGDVSLFIGCKLLGTAGVLFSLMWLVKNYRHIAVPIVRSLTVFQTWLLWFLTCSVVKDPLIPIAENLMVIVIAAICLWSFAAEYQWALVFRRVRLLFGKLLPRRDRFASENMAASEATDRRPLIQLLSSLANERV